MGYGIELINDELMNNVNILVKVKGLKKDF